jgi:cyclohexanecarboxylate-CoA ligase
VTEPITDAVGMWELVARRAAATPDRLMLVDERDRAVSFGEFRHRAERVAAGLADLGVGPGTVVTWQLPTRIETILVATALARLGAIQNPVIHLYREREVGFALGQMASELYLCPGTFRDFNFAAMGGRLAAELPRPPRVEVISDDLPDGNPSTLPPVPAAGGADDVRWVYYTSGTTSDPKGVRHSDRTLIEGGRGLALAIEMSADDVGSMAFPFAHIAGPDYLVMLLTLGFPAVLLEAFVPDQAVEVLKRHGATMAGGSTAFYQAYLAVQRKTPGTPLIPSLRVLSGGGAAMPPEIFHEVAREMGVRIAHGYGMTEIPMIAMGSPSDSDEQLANTVGRPVAGADLRIVTADGAVAPPGVDGEVRVRGPMVCKGYTDEALNEGAFDDDGYFRTGDLGHLRPDGHVVLTGRLKDVIIRKGENISAKEIEDLLYGHTTIRDVAVIGLPDSERGERVCAVVEAVPGVAPITLAEMAAYLREAGLMAQKMPEQLIVVNALPRNETLNKVLKQKLRDRYAEEPWAP